MTDKTPTVVSSQLDDVREAVTDAYKSGQLDGGAAQDILSALGDVHECRYALNSEHDEHEADHERLQRVSELARKLLRGAGIDIAEAVEDGLIREGDL